MDSRAGKEKNGKYICLSCTQASLYSYCVFAILSMIYYPEVGMHACQHLFQGDQSTELS